MDNEFKINRLGDCNVESPIVLSSSLDDNISNYVTDDELAYAAGNVGTTIFHPVGSCKMGQANDPGAVTDSRLRVLGVSGLRVVDASVMPTITSGNTSSPTIMIATQGAEMIRKDRKQAQ